MQFSELINITAFLSYYSLNPALSSLKHPVYYPAFSNDFFNTGRGLWTRVVKSNLSISTSGKVATQPPQAEFFSDLSQILSIFTHKNLIINADYKSSLIFITKN